MNIICKHCAKEYVVPVSEESLGDHKNLESWKQELINSETCNDCFNKMFPGPLLQEDEDYWEEGQ